MANVKYEDVMKILEDARRDELECARIGKELMRKTLNPFRRISIKRECDILINHSIGIGIAMHRIKRELES